MVYSLRAYTRKPTRFADVVFEDELEKEEQREPEKEEEEVVREEETVTEPKRPKLIEPGENSRAPTDTEPEPEIEAEAETEVTEAEQEMKNSITVILTDPDVLECCICFQSLNPPIFQCDNGHIACSACCLRIGCKCPSCSLPIGYKRCLAMEKVVESIKVPCPNSRFGCQETIIYSHKSAHEQSCSYSPCHCPISTCDFTGPSGQLSQHFTSAHTSLSRRFYYGYKFTVWLDRCENFAVLQSVDDGLLFLVKNRKEELGNSIAVIAIGTSAPQTEFQYDLVAKRGASSLRFHSNVACFKGLAEACSGAMEVLVVPRDFFSCSGQIKLDVCIKQP